MRTSNLVTSRIIRGVQALVVTAGLFGIMVLTVPYWLKPLAALAEVPCTVPYTFINGTVAQASQVNANFSALTTCLTTIYASDIVPATQAQATFGGTLQYNFPAGVAVAGGIPAPFTDVTGPLWITQSGQSNGTYGINFDMNGCGGTGAYQFKVATVFQDSIGCTGIITNQQGSIFGNDISANSGRFVGLSGPAQLCAVVNTNPCLQVTTAGNVTAPGTVQAGGPVTAIASPQPANSPAPVAPCYTAAGAPCPTTFHSVWIPGTSITIASCTNTTSCSFTGGSANCSTTTACNFAQPDGPWDVVCSAVIPSQSIILTADWVSGSPPTINVQTALNETGGTITSTSYHVGILCSGP